MPPLALSERTYSYLRCLHQEKMKDQENSRLTINHPSFLIVNTFITRLAQTPAKPRHSLRDQGREGTVPSLQEGNYAPSECRA